jgi:hypothetical protein
MNRGPQRAVLAFQLHLGENPNLVGIDEALLDFLVREYGTPVKNGRSAKLLC